MILNTRPRQYRDRFHAAFGGLGLPIVDCPLLTAVATHAVIPAADGFDAVIITSQIAIEFFAADGAWRAKTVYAVGPVTGAAARAAGFANVIVTGYAAAALSQVLAKAAFTQALYPSAADVAADLAQEFPSRVHRVAVYTMAPVAHLPDTVLRAVADGRFVIAPLFSRRSAGVLAGLLGGRGEVTAVAASAKVIAGAGPWRNRAIAENPTLDAVAAATRTVIQQ